MGNKKFLIAIIILVLALFGLAAYLFWPKANKSNQPASTSTEINQFVASYDSSGQGIVLDVNNNQIKKIDSKTGKSTVLYAVEGTKPNYFALSNNEKSLFITTDVPESDITGDSSDLEHLSVVSLDNSFTKVEENNVFSPVWISNEKIAYYVLDQDKGQLVVKDIKQNKNINQVKIEREGTQQVSVLDENNVLINDFSSDVGDIASSIINLKTGKITPYLSGLGLKFKTVPGSKFVGYQVIENDQATTRIVDWQSKAKILEKRETIDNFDWLNTDKEIIYGTNGQLYRFEITSAKSTALNRKYTEPLLVIKLLSGNNLLLKTEEKSETIDLGGL